MPLVDEKWLPVAGFDGYLASPDGRIVSIKRKRPVLLRAWRDKDGYAMVPLRRDSAQIQSSVARIIDVNYDVKLNIGYDTVRQQSFVTMSMHLDAKGSDIQYKKMIIGGGNHSLSWTFAVKDIFDFLDSNVR